MLAVAGGILIVFALMGVLPALGGGDGAVFRFGGVASPNIAISKSIAWDSSTSFTLSSLTFHITLKLMSVRISCSRG